MTESPSVLDLRLETCPYTFVKTRLALEDLGVGDEIVLLLGNPESAASVPRSLKQEGQEVLAVDEIESRLWRIRVRKLRP